MGRDLEFSGVNSGYGINAIGTARRKIINEQKTGHFPWSTGSVGALLASQIRIKEIADTRSPPHLVIIHLDRPKPRIAANDERFAGCPHSAAPEQIVDAHQEAEAVRMQIVQSSEMHGAACSRGFRQIERVIA